MTASERAAGELVADVDMLAAAIRGHINADPRAWLSASETRALAEGLVAAGFGRIDAAQREALLSASNDLNAEPDSRSYRQGTDEATRIVLWLRDRAHQIGATS